MCGVWGAVFVYFCVCFAALIQPLVIAALLRLVPHFHVPLNPTCCCSQNRLPQVHQNPARQEDSLQGAALRAQRYQGSSKAGVCYLGEDGVLSVLHLSMQCLACRACARNIRLCMTDLICYTLMLKPPTLHNPKPPQHRPRRLSGLQSAWLCWRLLAMCSGCWWRRCSGHAQSGRYSSSSNRQWCRPATAGLWRSVGSRWWLRCRQSVCCRCYSTVHVW